jgi:hypothetical protein
MESPTAKSATVAFFLSFSNFVAAVIASVSSFLPGSVTEVGVMAVTLPEYEVLSYFLAVLAGLLGAAAGVVGAAGVVVALVEVWAFEGMLVRARPKMATRAGVRRVIFICVNYNCE